VPGGVRTTGTEAWGAFDFELSNRTDRDRLARVLVFFAQRPDAQYGRDLWVPARSTLRSWTLVGPSPVPKDDRANEIQMLLYDRSEGKDQLILPRQEERIRDRLVRYRKRDPTTSVLVETVPSPLPVPGDLPAPEPRWEEVLRFVRTFRHAQHLSEVIIPVHPTNLPPTPEAFDGIDQLAIASDALANDPAGTRAVRQWLERGGKVWVMLDRVALETVAPLLGDALDFQVVDRVSLTSFRVHTQSPGLPADEGPAQSHEKPVDLVRVLLPPHERVRHTVDGWPVWFTRPVGQGTVLFMTLGDRGWSRPRQPHDRRSPYQNFPDLPVPHPPLEAVAAELYPKAKEGGFQPIAFRQALAEDIGYQVLGRGTAGLVFALFLAGTLGLGLALRQSRRPEMLGWLAPAAALLATATFLVLGERSRRSAPATLAVAQIVDGISGTPEASIHGLLSVYRPDSGPVPAAGARGLFELDLEAVEGQTRRFLLTDMDSWRLEGLTLPAGVRSAPFRANMPTGAPITAVARLGPDGLEGKLEAGPFGDLEDAILSTQGGRNLAVRLNPDGSFRAGSQDALPAGQFLTGALLSDRQQRRQGLYRQFLRKGNPLPPHLDGRNALLAWASPLELPFTLGPEARTSGTALLAVPLQLERPAPGTLVTIPGPLLAVRRILNGRPVRVILESRSPTTLHLRFQLPPELLPLEVERARLSAKIDAPGRLVTVAVGPATRPVEIHRTESPLQPLAVVLAGPQLPPLDDDGGLHLHLTLGEQQAGGQDLHRADSWTIHYIELEVTGRIR
jgi:hypothetical protein